ncbi:ABC transporter ATP-binding protein [Alphaproteobacteria bacterium]|jgi:branched-chain amino acid transport system ATP-binding protein|nr:ABC transporter ATP-binding protein [Alphaproteobacteria bacterium]|tara:strand:+ start:278 stop:982 length:705 start_codon:yes stop_codon:yes gene_type:complete
MYLLSGENITCGYSSVDILSNCTIGVKRGQIASIVGPNGAGKSTAMKAIFGLLGIRKGKILLDGEDITSLHPQDRVLKGMGFVPQTNNIFPSLSVQENLEMGAFIQDEDCEDMLNYIYELFPILKDKRYQQAGELSGGQRQQVAVGRALMTNPKVLMLDEPSAGVSPIVMEGIFKKIKEIANQGTAILMVEQNAKQALEISDLGFVLNQGKNLFTDTGKSLLNNKEVRQAFLGG